MLKAGQGWAMGQVMQMLRGRQHLFAETTNQRGKWSRKGSDRSKSTNSSRGNLVSTSGCGPSFQELWDCGLHDKAAQNTWTPDSPQFYPLSPADLTTITTKQRKVFHQTLIWSPQPTVRGWRIFSPALPNSSSMSPANHMIQPTNI